MYSFIDSLKFLYGGLSVISPQFIYKTIFLSLILTVYIQIILNKRCIRLYHTPPRFQLVPVFLTEGTCLTLWWDFLVVVKQIILKGKETIQLQTDNGFGGYF